MKFKFARKYLTNFILFLPICIFREKLLLAWIIHCCAPPSSRATLPCLARPRPHCLSRGPLSLLRVLTPRHPNTTRAPEKHAQRPMLLNLDLYLADQLAREVVWKIIWAKQVVWNLFSKSMFFFCLIIWWRGLTHDKKNSL